MKRSRTPVAWLRVFDVAARHLSFSAAAEELHVTPSAVSQQIRLLEQRVRTGTFSTPATRLALDRGRRSVGSGLSENSFGRLDAALLELFGDRTSDRLVIRVAAGFARHWLLQQLARFSASNPDFPIRIVASVWASDPLDPNVELDIRVASGPIGGMSAVCLTQDELFPVCSPALTKRPAALRRATDLGRHPLLHTIGFAQGGQSGWQRRVSGGRRVPRTSSSIPCCCRRKWRFWSRRGPGADQFCGRSPGRWAACRTFLGAPQGY